MRGKEMNWEVIASNLGEAGYDIKKVLDNLSHPDMTVLRFKVHIEHILRHMLFAWNARHVTKKHYAEIIDEDFSSWSRIHSDLVPLGANMDSKLPSSPRLGKFDRGWAKRYLERHWTKSEREFTWAMRRKKKKT